MQNWTISQELIEQAFDNRQLLNEVQTQATINAVIAALDAGELRTAQPIFDAAG